MRCIDLPFNQSLRVWLNESSGALLDEAVISSFELSSYNEITPKNNFVAVEWFRPQGAMFSYGLLGLKFWPSISPRIRFEIRSLGKRGVGFRNETMANLDEINVGLPAEFVGSVAGGMRDFAENSGKSFRGKIEVSEAAYGFIGSSGEHFWRLSKISMAILLGNGSGLKDEEMEGILSRI